MGTKIVRHPGPKKNIINKMRLRFPRLNRLMRSGTEFNDREMTGKALVGFNKDELEEIPVEEKHFYEPPLGIRMMRFSKTLADEGYIKWGEIYVDTFIGKYLDHVLYRCLKLVYGWPDPITVHIMKEEASEDGKIVMNSRPAEWGYLIQGKGGSCFDIIKRFRECATEIVLWLNTDSRPSELPKEVENGLQEFMKTFHNLVEIVDREYKIEEEIELIRKIAKVKNLRAYVNLYYQNFQAGKDILELSDTLKPDLYIQHNELFSKGEFDEALQIVRKMSILYVSAIVYFFMALEGFINLIYKLLLKPQFTHKMFDRAVWKADLDLRILHMPVYCRGFTNADITPDSEVYKRWLSIRDFRNNLVHSNITKECEVISTIEDSFLFTYNPLWRTKLKDKDKIKFHTQFTSISKDDANNVMKTVELIVSEIIEKMDEEIKVWVKRWIGEFFTDFSGI